MAGQLRANRIPGRKPSWIRDYFTIENRLLLGRKSKILAEGLADVSSLPTRTCAVCGRVFKHSPRNGTKNLFRHVLDYHNFDKAVMAEIARHGLKIQEVNIIYTFHVFLAYV